MKMHDLRKEYQLFKLSQKTLKENPLEQLKWWIDQAQDYALIEPNAMVLATATKEGKPSSRVMLLKEIDKKGLVFYTNLESKKGQDLLENPFASATFYWKELERQASFLGKVVKLSKTRSFLYFQSRPRDSKISAWASRQGSFASSRKAIDEAFLREEMKWQGKEISMPPYWGGFMLIPDEATFWQGREKRLHDRFLYKRTPKKKWIITRLYP